MYIIGVMTPAIPILREAEAEEKYLVDSLKLQREKLSLEKIRTDILTQSLKKRFNYSDAISFVK